MNASVIFDLDQTLIDSSGLEVLRKRRDWDQVYKSLHKIEEYQSVSEILNTLNQNSIKIIIITTSPSAYCRRIVDQFGWDIAGCICYHDVYPNIKPHPEAFLKAINDYNLDIDQTISVGDRSIDIEASQRAHIPSIGCTWGSPDTASLLYAGPTFIANNTAELYLHLKTFHSIK